MIWLVILILAVIQGITEFLPVSSSGHFVVVEALLEQFGRGVESMDAHQKLTTNVVLHVGTLLAVLVFYRRQILRLFGEDRRVIGLLIVGSMPAAVVGLVLRVLFKDTLTSPLAAGLLLPVTGVMLLWTAKREPGERIYRNMGYARALVIGSFQAAAILPGISRSGATIVAGLACGLRREEAATFSFLLAIPAITGAALLELKDLLIEPNGQVSLGPLAAGAFLSFAVGLLSLWWLVRWVRQGRLHLFAWWVIPLGIAVILWQLLG